MSGHTCRCLHGTRSRLTLDTLNELRALAKELRIEQTMQYTAAGQARSEGNAALATLHDAIGQGIQRALVTIDRRIQGD